ncbi:conserved hypothetical protein [Neospora caninum Liverpool]|uniref:Uncharacterized protein n=1 Tax=Neospora caninum (strain Liverpool) TaxID=572307 RepID=F0V9Y9_NEOCL|nr:conserved hypothetical protein [Neospora caninum Liverpool]CBZ50751.1 conserved hypothetical protein [Neospora caninum Liverpool]|eukprot:XP_003880784.1 conserved hypothetical protein [Neospora caninum Liverpool]
MLANDLCRLLPLLPFPSSVEQVHVYSRALSARIREEEEHRRRFRENARRKKRKKRTEQARISMSKQGYFSSESSSSFSCPWASSGQSRPAEKDAAACDRNEGEAEREDSRFKSAPPTLPAALHALRLRKSPLAPSSLHAPTKAAEEAACESPEKGQEEGGNEQRVFPAENQSVASLSSRPPLQGSPLWTSRSRVETFGSLSFTPDKAVASALLVLVLRRISLRLEKKRGGSHLDGVSPRSVSVLANAVALLCTATLPQLLDEAAQAAGAARRDSRLSTLSMLPSEVASEVEAGDTTEGADEGTEESERQREKQRRTQEENRNMGRRPEIDRGCEEDRQAIGAVSPEGKRGAEEGDAQKLPGFRGKTGTLHVPRASKVQWRRDEGRQEQIHASAWTFAAKANDAGRRSVIDLSSQPNGQLFCRAFFSPDSPSLQDNSSLRSAASLSLPSSSSSPSPSSSAPGEDCPEMLTARLAAMASTAGRCLLFGETKNGEESFLIQSCVRQLEIFKGKDATMLLQALVRLHAAPVCGGANQGKPGEMKAEVAEERREGGTERTSQDVEKLKETVDKVDVRLQSTAWSVLAQK